jgi:tetratricopeptide (TPR) repeat protein
MGAEDVLRVCASLTGTHRLDSSPENHGRSTMEQGWATCRFRSFGSFAMRFPRCIFVLILLSPLRGFGQHGVTMPSGADCSLALTTIVCSHQLQSEAAFNGRSAEARSLLLQAAELVRRAPPEQQQSLVANISGQLVRAGALSDALATVRMLARADDQASVMGNVGWQLVHDGSTAQALTLIAGSQNGSGKDLAYTLVAKLLGEQKSFSSALQTAHLIQGPFRRLESLLYIAVLQAKAGTNSDASPTLAEALQIARDLAPIHPNNAMSLFDVARVQAEIGETPETVAPLAEFSALAHKTRDENGGDFLLQFLASLKAQLGDLAGAVQTIQDLSQGAKDADLEVIAAQYAKRNSMGQAIALAAQISSANREGALGRLAIVECPHGECADAMRAIDTIRDPENRARALANLALELGRWHNPAARQTLLLWEAVNSGDIKLPDFVRGTAAVSYGLLDDFGDAERIVGGIAKPEGRQWPLWNLTRFLAAEGNVPEAMAIAENESDPYPKAYAFLGTAEGILDEGEAKRTERNLCLSLRPSVCP